jgi:hypothetical protein
MSIDDSGKDIPHKIEDINKKLYSPRENAIVPKREGVLHKVSKNVSETWNSEKAEEIKQNVKKVASNSSFFKKFFIGSSIFFVCAVLFGLYMFFGGGSSVSNDNVSINILGNAFVPGGEELPLTLEIVNKNSVPLELADLVIEYSKTDEGIGSGTQIERKRQTLGTINAGQVRNEKVNLTLFGKEGSTKEIKFTIEYRVPNSNAIFQKEKLFRVNISSSPLSINISAKPVTTANQDYEIEISIVPNSSKTVPNMLVRIDYPIGFKFISSDPGPSFLNSVWDIGDLESGVTKRIKIKGQISGEDGEERSFRVYTGTKDAKDKNVIAVVHTSAIHTVDIVRPFIEARLSVNNNTSPEIVVGASSSNQVKIDWANNLPVRILDAEIEAKIVGTLVDRSSITATGGFYNSSENKVVWNRNTLGTFDSLEPGESGSVGFNFKIFPLYRNGQLVDQPQIEISVSIKGKQPQEGNFSSSIDSFEKKIIKVRTDFQISGQSFYINGPFTNSGPIPPTADQKTTYTIRWTATNTSNTVTNATLRASLPTYVRFLNIIDPTAENITVDPLNGELTWKIGTVGKGAGFTTPAKSVYFKVEITPSLSQVGTAPILVNEMTATGTDSFTNTELISKWKEINTKSFNDPGFVSGNENVVQ